MKRENQGKIAVIGAREAAKARLGFLGMMAILLDEGFKPAVPELKFQGLMRSRPRFFGANAPVKREAYIARTKKELKRRKRRRQIQNASRRANRLHAHSH